MVRLVSIPEQRWVRIMRRSQFLGTRQKQDQTLFLWEGRVRVRRMRGFIAPAFSTKPSGEAFTVTVGILRKPRLGIGLEETESLNLESNSHCRAPGFRIWKNNCFSNYGCCHITL